MKNFEVYLVIRQPDRTLKTKIVKVSAASGAIALCVTIQKHLKNNIIMAYISGLPDNNLYIDFPTDVQSLRQDTLDNWRP